MANEEQKKPVRPRSVFQLYTTDELLQRINSIPEIKEGVTGNDKVSRIIESFEFMHQWKDKVANWDASSEDNAATIADLESQLEAAQSELESVKTERDNARKAYDDANTQIQNLTHDLEEAQSNNVNAESDAARIAELESQLEAAQTELEAARTTDIPSWEQIRRSIDPAYADMCEEMATRMSTSDQKVNPLMAAIDIFVRYHIYHLTELPFQPLMDKKTITEILQRHYPDVTVEGFIKKLEGKK